MTIKGLLGFLVPIFIMILQGAGVTDVDQQFFDTLINSGTEVVEVGALFVSTFMVFFGLLRKLWTYIKRAVGVV